MDNAATNPLPPARTLIEVGLVFCLMVVFFRVVLAIFPPPETGLLAGRPVAAYLALLVASILLTELRRPVFETVEGVRPNLQREGRVLGRSFLPFFVLGLALDLLSWQTPGGALVIILVELVLLVWLVFALRGTPAPEAIPALLLAVFLPLHQLSSGTRLGEALTNLVYFYLVVAPAEELLFRGYIQGKLNLVLSRPWHWMRLRWGWGLVIASLLFGLWHLFLQPLSLATGLQALWTVLLGVMLGVVREKTGHIRVPSILHGVVNYGPGAFLYDLLRGG
jgi:uncharacterized protein